MAVQLQLRSGTTIQHSTFIGAVGEVTVDTTKKTLVVHDGVTAGGTPLLNASQLVDSTSTVKGVARFATDTEVINKSNVSAAVTPKNVVDMFLGGFSDKDFAQLPNGLIIQWGIATEYVTESFKRPFPNKCLSIQVTPMGLGNDSSGAVTLANIINNSSFIFYCGINNGNTAHYLAIGY